MPNHYSLRIFFFESSNLRAFESSPRIFFCEQQVISSMSHVDGLIRNAWGMQTRIMWSRYPTAKALVFVHGFLGSPEAWEGIPTIILEESQLSGYDAFFIEYSSEDPAELTASALKNFLTILFEGPETIFASEFRRIGRRAAAYSECSIAALDLGTIVARLALVAAYNDRSAWVEKTKLLQFIPLIPESDITSLGIKALGPFGQFADVPTEVLTTKYPSLLDIEANRSPEAQTRTQTPVVSVEEISYPSALFPESVSVFLSMLP